MNTEQNESVTCPICLEEFNLLDKTPVQFGICLHVCCRPCLNRLYDIPMGWNQPRRCPVCREGIPNDRPSLFTSANHIVRRIQRALEVQQRERSERHRRDELRSGERRNQTGEQPLLIDLTRGNRGRRRSGAAERHSLRRSMALQRLNAGGVPRSGSTSRANTAIGGNR